MATRAEQRLKINKLLALAARPGTKAEGEAAWAAAVRCAERYGFKIVRKRPKKATVGGMHARSCRRCGQGFVTAATGRPRVYCSGACRVAAHRARRRSGSG